VASRSRRNIEGVAEVILLVLFFGLGFLIFKGGIYLIVGVVCWLSCVFAWFYFSLYGLHSWK
jgi:hypothetical protein